MGIEKSIFWTVFLLFFERISYTDPVSLVARYHVAQLNPACRTFAVHVDDPAGLADAVQIKPTIVAAFRTFWEAPWPSSLLRHSCHPQPCQRPTPSTRIRRHDYLYALRHALLVRPSTTP